MWSRRLVRACVFTTGWSLALMHPVDVWDVLSFVGIGGCLVLAWYVRRWENEEVS